jgi:protein required for attachment to host cells
MTEAETLIVVADGGRARGFAERRRHGPLQELPGWSRAAPPAERRGRGRGGTTITPGSGRSNADEASPAEAAEARFLDGLAHELEHAAVVGRYERLVLVAPPRALGRLRGGLGPQASRRLEVSDPHDRLSATASEIRARLRDIRVPA